MLNASSHPLYRIARNALSVLAGDALNRATTFILYALVARYLDAHAFGQLSLALAFFYAFQVFATLGLPTLITREVASDRERLSACLLHGGVLAFAGSWLAIVGLLGGVAAMGYATDTSQVIVLMSLGLVPHALGMIGEAVLRGREEMHLIVFANAPANIAKVAGAWWLLASGGGVYEVVFVLIGSRTLAVTLLAAMALLPRRRSRKTSGDALPEANSAELRDGFRWSIARGMLRRTSVFLGIDSLVAIWASINVLLLSKLCGEVEVGLFNSAAQLLTPFVLLNMSVTTSVFPLLCRRFQGADREASLAHAGGRLLDVLLVVSLPCAVGLFWLAEDALALAYGNREFTEAALALRILAAGIVLRAITMSLGHMLYASHNERTTLRIVLVNASLSFVLSLVLIHRFGIVGAAAAVVVTQAIDVLQHLWPVSRLLPDFRLRRHLWKPALATTVMAGALLLIAGQSVLAHVATGVAAYTAVAAPLLFGKRWLAARDERAGLRESFGEL